MKDFIYRHFSGKTMGFKLTVMFLSVILIPMTLLAYFSYRVIDSRLEKESHEKLDMGLKAAWNEYFVRGEQMRYGMLQAAAQDEIKHAVESGDRTYLRNMMIRWKHMRPYVELWAVVDAKGRVISRLNSDYSGDVMDLNGLVNYALASGEADITTGILTKDMLRFEGNEFRESLSIPGPSSGLKGEMNRDAGDAIFLLVVTPVMNDQGKVIGGIVTGDILNGDSFIPDTVARRNPGLFTSVSLNGTRISTNLVDANGENLKGTRLPASALEATRKGRHTFQEWSLGGRDYISVFEPIRDYKGAVIGTLDVGISKEGLWAVQRENQLVISIITALGLSISLIAAVFSTYRITRPLKNLKEKIDAFAAGDRTVRVDAEGGRDAGDEIKTLSRAFNSMMDDVGRREEDKERYLAEIEDKNRELGRLNDAIKKTNEELEVAYEETQSQTEELHAINEELKLLNEDLDRKNVELKKANITITVEEEEIKKAKDKLRLIYDSILDYVLLVDGERNILEANRHFYERLNLDERLAAGRNIYPLFKIRNPGTDCPITRSIDTLTPVEMEMTSSEGKVYLCHSFPLIHEYEGQGKAVVYMKDITEQRLLLHRLIQADKLSSLGELVSGVAHELNNPLTGIMCFSELLMEDSISENVRGKLAKINDASHRCKKIIDNLLTFARWNRPEKKYENVNNVIRRSVELRSYQLKVDNIGVDLDLDETLPSTMLDENQMQQVFLNLMNNARDAIMEKGGGGKIWIKSGARGGKVVVRFVDDGKGIPEEVIGRIFDPFFTTKEVGRGTGLGLSISYGIINEHGGNIYASSDPGRGTTFTVELPITGTGYDMIAAKPPKPDLSGRLRERAAGLKALVLDDEPIVLDLLNDMLASSGFVVEAAASAEDALAKMRAGGYDIIISDIKMPGLDGKGFYRAVRDIRPEMLQKIIFITGDSVNKETDAFLRESGNVSLKKPFTVDELNECVSRLIL